MFKLQDLFKEKNQKKKRRFFFHCDKKYFSFIILCAAVTFLKMLQGNAKLKFNLVI